MSNNDNDLFRVDIDRSNYRKILLRNPRLMFNTLFTKPSMSIEYLNKCYNQGIEVTNIIGEDKVIETIENIEVTDIKLFDELDDIIFKDEELSIRLTTIKELNEGFNPDLSFWDYPNLCVVLFVIISFKTLHCLFQSTIFSIIFYEILKETSIIFKIFEPIFQARYEFSFIILFGLFLYTVYDLECLNLFG